MFSSKWLTLLFDMASPSACLSLVKFKASHSLQITIDIYQRVLSKEQCLLIFRPLQHCAQSLKWHVLAFAWVTGHFSIIHWAVMSSRHSHQKPRHRAAPHYSRAAGQAGGLQPAYHRDNAVFCKTQGQKDSMALSFNSQNISQSGSVYSSKKIWKRLLRQSCGPMPSSEKHADVSAAL